MTTDDYIRLPAWTCQHDLPREDDCPDCEEHYLLQMGDLEPPEGVTKWVEDESSASTADAVITATYKELSNDRREQ